MSKATTVLVCFIIIIFIFTCSVILHKCINPQSSRRETQPHTRPIPNQPISQIYQQTYPFANNYPHVSVSSSSIRIPVYQENNEIPPAESTYSKPSEIPPPLTKISVEL